MKNFQDPKFWLQALSLVQEKIKKAEKIEDKLKMRLNKYFFKSYPLIMNDNWIDSEILSDINNEFHLLLRSLFLKNGWVPVQYFNDSKERVSSPDYIISSKTGFKEKGRWTPSWLLPDVRLKALLLKDILKEEAGDSYDFGSLRSSRLIDQTRAPIFFHFLKSYLLLHNKIRMFIVFRNKELKDIDNLERPRNYVDIDTFQKWCFKNSKLSSIYPRFASTNKLLGKEIKKFTSDLREQTKGFKILLQLKES